LPNNAYGFAGDIEILFSTPQPVVGIAYPGSTQATFYNADDVLIFHSGEIEGGGSQFMALSYQFENIQRVVITNDTTASLSQIYYYDCNEQSRCGDGLLDEGEACDDANNSPTDGCGASCSAELKTLPYLYEGESLGASLGSSIATGGDVDGDGVLDFALYSATDSVRIFSGATGGLLWFAGPSNYFTVSDMALVDLNGDQLADLVIATKNEIWVFDAQSRTLVNSYSLETTIYSVATTQDINNDGTPEILVGHEKEHPSFNSVTLLSGKDGSLIRKHNCECLSEVGRSVSNLGDVDNDGVEDYGAGSHNYFGSVLHSDAKIYSGKTGDLIFGVEGGKRYMTIAYLGDINGDDHADVLLGTHNEQDFGKAKIYSGKTFEILAAATAQDANDYFGISLASVGDMTGDGIADFIVGARQNHYTHMGAGYAQLFSSANGFLEQTWTGENLRDAFGTQVAPVGDIDSDGISEILIAAPQSDLLSLSNGQVHIY
jgi:cysteine-rich repeat protein